MDAKTLAAAVLILVLVAWCTPGLAWGAPTWVVTTPGAPGRAAVTRVLPATAAGLALQHRVPGFMSTDVQAGGVAYRRLALPCAGRTTRVGLPELPVLKRLVHVPLGAAPVLTNIRSTSKVLAGFVVWPAQAMPEDREGLAAAPFQRDAAVYASNAWYPPAVVEVGDVAVVRGQQVATIVVNPIQVNAAARQIRVHDEVTYNVTFRGAAAPAAAAAAARRYSPAFGPVLSAQVAGFTAPVAARWALAPVASALQLAALQGCDYLIITRDQFYEELEPLVAHKEAKGLIVKRVKLSTLGAAPTAEQIRTYLRNRYETQTPTLTYVLLVGDADAIPPHYKTNHPKDSELRLKMGTDLYYGCVDGDDMLPDVFVGRMPAKTEAEVTSMVAKTIAWETDLGQDAAWTRSMVYAGYFQDESPADGHDERAFLQTVERVRTYFAGTTTEKGNAFAATRVYVAPAGSPAAKFYEDGTPVPASVTFSANPTPALLAALNAGPGFVWHRDHGGSRNGPNGTSDGWSEPSFTTAHVAQLTNPKPFVAFSINCRTGWFDGETDADTGAAVVDCLAEALVRRPSPAGAVAVVGSSRNSPSYPNNDLTLGLVEAAYPGILAASGAIPAHEPLYHLGPALVFAKNYVRQMWGGVGEPDVVREYEMYNILGDPDLQLRYRRPDRLKVQAELYRPWVARLLARPPVPVLRSPQPPRSVVVPTIRPPAGVR